MGKGDSNYGHLVANFCTLDRELMFKILLSSNFVVLFSLATVYVLHVKICVIAHLFSDFRG